MFNRLTYSALCILICKLCSAQNPLEINFNLGDPAPPLRVKQWSKADSSLSIEKGRIYVLEFWATWSQQSLEAMPYLSEQSAKYNGKVRFIGVNVYEKKSSPERTQIDMDSLSNIVQFPLVRDDGAVMVNTWFKDAGESSIPVSFIITDEGKIAWIGYPTQIESVLPKIIDRSWDIQTANALRNEERRLASLEREASYQWSIYGPDPDVPGDLGKPDSLLIAAQALAQKEPHLKNRNFIFTVTFGAMLKIDQHQACLYARQMQKLLPGKDFFNAGIFLQVANSDTTKVYRKEIYKLAIKTLKARIKESPSTVPPDFYHMLASFYAKIKKKKKAVANEKKAIQKLTAQNHLVERKMPEFLATLEAYQTTKRSQLPFVSGFSKLKL